MIRILAVDDEEAILETVALLLKKKEDIDSDTCTSPKEALELMENTSYDLILSDYEMPGMTGLELLAAMRERRDKTPFILFTGKSREEIAIAALNDGVDYYLQKGGNIRVLLAEMAHIIRKTVEKERDRKKIRHLTRILSTIRRTQEIVAEERNFTILLKSICDLITAEGGYRDARIILFEKPGEIFAAEQSGFGDEFDRILEWLKKGELTGCAKEALDSGRTIISEECSAGCTGCPFRDRHRCGGAMTRRIITGGRVIGIVSVTLPSDFILDKDEQFLFETLAEELGKAVSRSELFCREITEEEYRQNIIDFRVFENILTSTDNLSTNLMMIEDMVPKSRMVSGYIRSAERAAESIKHELRVSGALGKKEHGFPERMNGNIVLAR